MALWDTVIVVPFNDVSAVEQAFQDNPGEIAAVILEPVMMNIGLVVRQPGYLRELRDACERHGAALIYDEVKCGGTAPGLAALTQVLTKDAHDNLGKVGTMLAEGCKRAMDDHDVRGHRMDPGAKGCDSFRKEPLTNYRDFLKTIPEFFYASSSWMINRGVFMTPGDEAQWTIAVQHDEDDIRRYVDALGKFCQELAG